MTDFKKNSGDESPNLKQKFLENVLKEYPPLHLCLMYGNVSLAYKLIIIMNIM